MLFIKFPYSVCYRYSEIMKKINEREEGMNSMEIYWRMKRIWSMHSKCHLL
jgi:hypothetical protein